MKFRPRTFFLLPLMLLLLSSTCEKDEEPEQNNIRPGALKANFNGQSIDFSYFTRANDSEVADSNLTGIYISGDTDDFTRYFSITIMPFSGTGQYLLDGIFSEGSFNSLHYETSPSGGGIVTSYGLIDGLTGTVNITQFDGEVIKGTFNAEIKCVDCNGNVELITVTNGVINAEYIGELY